MMGPDYTQWHGFLEVTKICHTEFIPEAEQSMSGGTTDVMNSDYHKWMKGPSCSNRLISISSATNSDSGVFDHVRNGKKRIFTTS